MKQPKDGPPHGVPEVEERPRPKKWPLPPPRIDLYTDDLISTHIVYNGDDETFRGAYSECLDYLRNQREILIGCQIHIAPIVAEVELQTKGSDARASDFVIFEDEDE